MYRALSCDVSSRLRYPAHAATVAQLAEHLICNLEVTGSIPVGGLDGGLWLPEHIKLSQYRMSERVVRADWKPVTPAYVELDMQAVRLQINKPIEWGQVLPRWDREPE